MSRLLSCFTFLAISLVVLQHAVPAECQITIVGEEYPNPYIFLTYLMDPVALADVLKINNTHFSLDLFRRQAVMSINPTYYEACLFNMDAAALEYLFGINYTTIGCSAWTGGVCAETCLRSWQVSFRLYGTSTLPDGSKRKGWTTINYDSENPFFFALSSAAARAPFGIFRTDMNSTRILTPTRTAYKLSYSIPSQGYSFLMDLDEGRPLSNPMSGLSGFILDPERSWEFEYVFGDLGCTNITMTQHSNWSLWNPTKIVINDFHSDAMAKLLGPSFAEPGPNGYNMHGAAFTVQRHDEVTTNIGTLVC